MLSLPLGAAAQDAETHAFRHEIKPGKIAEECRNLAADDGCATASKHRSAPSAK